MNPIRLIDATEPSWGHRGARHVDLRYSAPHAARSFFTGAVSTQGAIRGALCPQCRRIELYGVPDEE